MSVRFGFPAVLSLLCLWLSDIPLAAQDSLRVQGGIALGPDSIEAELDWSLTQQGLLPGADTAWTAVSRSTSWTCWGTSSLGRAQIEAHWPSYGDSIVVHFHADSSGLVLAVGRDTLFEAWSAHSTGCFPATSDAVLRGWMSTQEDTPFESKRHAAALRWLPNHCLTPRAVSRLVASFDDEGRRLSLIQHARVTQPDRLSDMDGLFFSSHYRTAYRRWIASTE